METISEEDTEGKVHRRIDVTCMGNQLYIKVASEEWSKEPQPASFVVLAPPWTYGSLTPKIDFPQPVNFFYYCKSKLLKIARS